MSTAFEIEFPGVTEEGYSPSWYDPIELDNISAAHWGEPSDDSPEGVGMEAAVYQDGDRVWVESWHESVGLTTFWDCPDLPTAIRLADFIVRGGL